MATAMDHDKHSAEHQQTEKVAEQISTSSRSGEIEAQNVDLEEKEAARVLRKVDMRLGPLLSLLYLVAFIDRSNSTYKYLRCLKLYGNGSLIYCSRYREDCWYDG